MKKRIDVVGIGPGHPDWLLPVARRILAEADCVVGGRRQLAELEGMIREGRVLEGNYQETADWILKEAGHRRIAVAVSGDTGFYSLLSYLKKNLPGIAITVTPGVSSLQVLFARLGLTWDQARLLSAHGRELPWEALSQDTVTGILTDGVKTPGVIAAELIRRGQDTLWMAVGENLSYDTETITLAPVKSIRGLLFEPLNAVVLMPSGMGEQLHREREGDDEA